MSVRGKRGEPPQVNGSAPPETETPPGEVPAETETKKNDKVELTLDQARSLTGQWVEKVNAQHNKTDDAKEAYESERGSLRELFKQVKGELGQEGLDRVKLLVKLKRDPEAEHRLRQQIETIMWAVQYAEALPGQQLQLITDLTPIEDRAFEQGKDLGWRGLPYNSRYGLGTAADRRFQEGYVEGQAILSKGFKPLEKPPEPIGDAEATHEVKAS